MFNINIMLNIREIIRRTLKYAVMVIVVGFAAHTIPSEPINKLDILWISLIAAMVFSILDGVTPSIKIHVEKKNKVNE